jgi:hypothetical protein
LQLEKLPTATFGFIDAMTAPHAHLLAIPSSSTTSGSDGITKFDTESRLRDLYTQLRQFVNQSLTTAAAAASTPSVTGEVKSSGTSPVHILIDDLSLLSYGCSAGSVLDFVTYCQNLVRNHHPVFDSLFLFVFMGLGSLLCTFVRHHH